MSTFHVHMLAAPAGFSAAVATMNSVAHTEAFGLLVGAAFAHEELGSGALDTSAFLGALAGEGVTAAQADGVVQALLFVCRGCIQHKVGADGEQLRDALQSYSEMADPAIMVLMQCWAAAEDSRTSATAAADGGPSAKRAFSIGQLESLDWKLGVAVSSNQCSQLVSPFVVLTFRVSDPNGEVATQKIELSYSEYQELTSKFSDAAAVLETL